MTSDGDTVNNEEWLLPSFLENAEEEIMNHKYQAKKALNELNEVYDLFTSCCEDVLALEGTYQSHPSEYTHYETMMKKLQRECDTHESKIFKYDQIIRNSEIDVKILKEQNEKLQDEILQLCEDTEKMALQEELLIKQRKEATESMQLMWSAYVKAKNTYKKILVCHIRLHDSERTDDIPNSEQEKTFTFSYLADDKAVLEVKLHRVGEIWKLLDAKPFVPAAVKLQTFLHETNDIRACLCRLREEALKLSRK